jgi:chromosomal replication initiator protein
MNVTDLIAKGNSKRLVRPRQIAMYLCRRLTKNSYPEIGRAFGGKDHATVMHSFKKIESLVTRDFAIQKQINDITHGLLK